MTKSYKHKTCVAHALSNARCKGNSNKIARCKENVLKLCDGTRLRCADPFQCGHEAAVSVREKTWRNIVVFDGMV